MRVRLALCVCTCLFVFGSASATLQDSAAWSRQHELALANGWSAVGVSDPLRTVAITLGLAPACGHDKVTDVLYSVSDPARPTYGQHLSQDAIASLVGSSPDVIAKVRAVVMSICASAAGDHHGCIVRSEHAHRDELTVTGPAAAIQALTGAPSPLHVFSRTADTGAVSEVVASVELPVTPAPLAPYVDLVSGVQLPFDGVADAATGSDKPMPMTGMAADESIYFIVLPSCQDGVLASNATDLCDGALVGFDVLANTSSGKSTYTTLPASAAQCVPAIYFPGVFCTINVNHSVIDNVMNQIYVRSVFSDGSKTAWAYYQGLTPTVWITPDDYFKLFQIPQGTTVKSNVSQSMVQFSRASYRPSDLDAFCERFGVPVPNVHVVGVNNASWVNFEPQLDMQMLAGVGRGAELWAWINEPSAAVEGIIGWASAVNTASDVPDLFSISYGSPAVVTTAAQRARLDYQLQKIGLRGITVMAATGDSGLQGGVNISCSRFTTTVLATSPYITAVGGSAIWTEGQQVGVQSDVGMYYTAAGGFSEFRPRAGFQALAVARFLNTSSHLPPSTAFNAAGRAIPDVASIALNAWTIDGGELQPTGGTSTASPSFSGVITLLNDARVSQGLSTLGWINPLLYAHPEAFTDVTTGNNRCSTWYQCCEYGFYAQKGWDPVTGLGSILYPAMKDIVLSLP